VITSHYQNIILRLLQSAGVLLFAAMLFSSESAFSQTFQANNVTGCAPLGVVISVTSPSAGSISSYQWQITAPNGSIVTATSTQYIAILTQPGTYDVALTINGNQTTSLQNYISVHALPEAEFTVNDAAGCFPHCVSFSDVSIVGEGDIVEWSWDFGDGTSSTDQNPSHCYQQTGTYTPVFSIEDEFGCFADITMPGLIHVEDHFPNASFTLSNQLDCNPPVDISMSNSSTGITALNAEWNFGDGQEQSVAGSGNITHTFLNTGVFDVCLTVSDDIGCEDEICQTVEIFNTANATFTVNPTNGCEGDVFTFASTTSPEPPLAEWDFNGDGSIDATGLNPTFVYPESGNFSPSLEVTYSSGCSDTHVGNSMLVQEGTLVSFVADQTASCSFPFAVSFQNLSVGPGTITYEWFIDGLSVGTGINLNYTFNAYGLYDVKLEATSSNGCINEFEIVDYIVVQIPTVSFQNGVSVCTNQTVPILSVSVNSVDSIAIYQWDFDSDGIIDALGSPPDYSYEAPGFNNITLTIQTVSGCEASFTNPQSINVLTEVDANFTVSATTTCAGEPVEFCVAEQPGNTFSWNFYDGSGWVIMSLSEDCIMHDFPDTGWFDVSLTVFNGACNIMQTIEDLIYVEPPVAKFEYQVLCGDMSAMFNDISIGADSIVWDFGDGSPLLINDHSPTHEYASSGIYTVLLTAFADGSDCPDTQSVDVVVSAPNANLSFTPNNGCPPLDVSIASEVFNPHWDVLFSTGDHIVVNWLENQGYWHITHTWADGAQTFGFSNPDYFWWPDIVIEDGGYVDVEVHTTDVNGCSTDLIYEDVIHVSSNPDFASFNVTTIDACNGVNLSFAPELENLTSWQWIFSDGGISNNENPTHAFPPPFNYNQPLTATLTATDSLGCSSTVTQEIDIILPPTVNFIAASDPSCAGDEVHFVNYSSGPIGTTYFWDFGDPASSENYSDEDAPSHVYAGNGTYEVCLSADNGAGCVRTYCNNQAVHIVDPEVSFTFTSNINNCLYGVQFNNTTPGTVVNSTWDFGDAQSGFGLMAFHTYPIGVYDVTLTVVNQFGCEAEFTYPDILNYGNQVGPFTQVLDTAMCAPFDVDIAAFNPADTYFEYFWDFNDGSGDASGNTSTSHTYSNPGTYCPSVIMTDPNGCPVLVSCSEPIVVEEFVLNYSVPAFLCYGDSAYITIENASSHEWENLQDISPGSLENEYILHPEDDTDYIITGFYADCVRTDTIHIEVKELPALSISEDQLVCHQDNPFSLSTGMPSDPPGSYAINGSIATEFDPSWTSDTNYLIEYFYTDTFNCSNSISQNIYIKPLPIVSLTDYGNVCLDSDTILLNQGTPVGGLYILEDDTISYFTPAIGTGEYEITYEFIDNDGCANDDVSNIVVRPIPQLEINFEDVCQDDEFIIENQSSIESGMIVSTVWQIGAEVITNAYSPPPVHFTTLGEQVITLTATSDFGCEASLDTSIIVHAVPLVYFNHGDGCQYAEQTYYDLSSIENDSMVSWLWEIEGVETISPDSITHNFLLPGVYDISLTVLSDFGCDQTLTQSVEIFPAPLPIATINDGCFGVESLFEANSTITEGLIISEEWDFGDDHPHEFGNTADNLYEAEGSYLVTYTATSQNGCSSVYADSITIYPLPEVDFIISSMHVCDETELQFLDLSTVNFPSTINNWNWQIESGEQSDLQNAIIRMTEPGTYDLSLHVETNHGCVGDSTLQNAIVVYPNPTAGFMSQDELSYSNPMLTITNTASEDVTAWIYDFGDETTETFSDGDHFYEDHGYYLISQIVTNTFGCSDSTSKLVTVHPQLQVFVPTAFTPDINGHNEVFYPVIAGFDITHYLFRVFDRWGIEVYSSNTPYKGWNGTFNDEPAQDGAYCWTLELKTITDQKIQRSNGSVILIR
jgi:gliding motility-associated-like protein